MKQFPAGRDIQLLIDVSAIDVGQAAQVQVFGEEPGAPALHTTNVNIDSGELSLPIPQAANALTTFEEARQAIVTAANGQEVKVSFLLVNLGALSIPELTFVSPLAADRLAARQLMLGDYWFAADEGERVTALRNARDKIARLVLQDRYSDGKSRAGYGIESSSSFRLGDLSASEFRALSTELVAAVGTAQVIEACEALRRLQTDDGSAGGEIASLTVGESTTVFRGSSGGMSARAKGVLARFLSPMKIARG